jgi:hypothetical protein
MSNLRPHRFPLKGRFPLGAWQNGCPPPDCDPARSAGSAERYAGPVAMVGLDRRANRTRTVSRLIRFVFVWGGAVRHTPEP